MQPVEPISQKEAYEACRASKWDPEDKNSIAEEIAHLHAELSEALEAWRKYKDCQIRYLPQNGKPPKPVGVPIEFADVIIGILYNCEREGFDLWDAVQIKQEYNRQRNYVEEGRQLHV